MTMYLPPSKEPEACKYLDPASIVKLCPKASEITVYGWDHCQYHNVCDVLPTIIKLENFPIKKVFFCAVGNSFSTDEEATLSLEKRKLNILTYSDSEDWVKKAARPCKTGLANIILENCKRKEEGKSRIPILFLIDTDENRHPTTPESMTAKNGLNSLVTNKELRRAFKLCHDPRLMQKIRQEACESFIFVHMRKIGKETYRMEKTSPPWHCEKWMQAWEKRLAVSKSKP